MIKMAKNVTEATVITHGGIFHADEVLATVILSKALGDINVLRTFKIPEEVPENVIIYDIGFGRFDHHQKGGNGTRENGVPYASCGLIWKEFGHKIVADTCCSNPGLVWELIDRDLIQGVDAKDNGTLPKVDYPAQAMSLSQVISGFNPNWDSFENSDEAFYKAVVFAEVILDNALNAAISKAKAESIVAQAIEAAHNQIMVLDQFVPWQEFLLSSKHAKAGEIQFVVFPSNRGGYNWQCVPDAITGQRKFVPTGWKGLNGLELQKVTGIATATFCHPAGFIGGAATLEDAIALAKIAITS